MNYMLYSLFGAPRSDFYILTIIKSNIYLTAVSMMLILINIIVAITNRKIRVIIIIIITIIIRTIIVKYIKTTIKVMLK